MSCRTSDGARDGSNQSSFTPVRRVARMRSAAAIPRRLPATVNNMRFLGVTAECSLCRTPASATAEIRSVLELGAQPPFAGRNGWATAIRRSPISIQAGTCRPSVLEQRRKDSCFIWYLECIGEYSSPSTPPMSLRFLVVMSKV